MARGDWTRGAAPAYTGAMPGDLLVPRPEGLWCPAGGFHIDPTRPVARALVTHAHSDHATGGHGAVLATRETLDIMAIRLGDRFPARAEAAAFGAPIRLGEVSVSFHPAGHVLGSAQIAVERGGRRIVASGDYKRTPDPTCAGFEPVPCDVFITEATFGLPVFRHPDPLAEIGRLIASLGQFPERTHLVGVYALGKAQRVIRLLRDAGYDAPVYLHGSLRRLCDYYASRGVALGALADATVARGTRPRLRRHGRARAALGLRRHLGAPLRRPARRLRLRLDAGPRPRPPARRRAAARHLRPRRLDRAHRDDRRARPLRGLGDARARGGAGALVRAAAACRRGRCTWSATRTRPSEA